MKDERNGKGEFGAKEKEKENFDEILLKIGTKYQILSIALLFVIKFLSGQSTINYMITANTLEYR